MHKIKKLMAWLLAVSAAASLSVPAYAAEDVGTEDYQITIQNNRKEGQTSIDGVNFHAYKVFDLTYPTMPETPSAEQANGAYTYSLSYGFTDFSFDPDGSGTAYVPLQGDVLMTFLQANSGKPEVIKQFAGEAYRFISQKAVTEPGFINKAQGKTVNAETGEENAVFNLGVPLSGSNMWNDKFHKYLGPGYYLVYMVPGDGSASFASGLLLDSTDPKISMEVKIQSPVLTKDIVAGGLTSEGRPSDTLKDAVYKMGDSVEFFLESSVPNMAAFDRYELRFHDTLPTGLTFVNQMDAFHASIGGEKVGVTVVNADNRDAYTNADSGAWLDIQDGSFDLVFKDLKKPLNPPMSLEEITPNENSAVTFYYTAKVNSNALGSNFEKNTAYMQFSNDPGNAASLGKTPEQHTRVFDFGIDVHKFDSRTDGSDGNPFKNLPNAAFMLFRATSAHSGSGVPDSANRVYYQYTDTANSTEDTVAWVTKNDGSVLYTDPNGNLSLRTENTGTDSQTNPYVYTADFFKGLTEGVYYLEETEAPVGYNAPQHPLQIQIQIQRPEDNTKVITGYRYIVTELNGDGVYAPAAVLPGFTAIAADEAASVNLTKVAEVPNDAGSELPTTGGMGTAVFYSVGSVMMAAAFVLLMTRKKTSC